MRTVFWDGTDLMGATLGSHTRLGTVYRSGTHPNREWKAAVTSPFTLLWTDGRSTVALDRYFTTPEEAKDYLWDVCNHHLMMEA